MPEPDDDTLLDAVIELRKAQRRFFRTRQTTHLNDAKLAEKRIDTLADRLAKARHAARSAGGTDERT